MSSYNEILKRAVTGTLCAGSLFAAGAVFADPASQATQAVENLERHAKIVFSVMPAGSREDAKINAVLQARAAALGRAPATLQEVDKWSVSLTAALREGGYPIGLVLMTDASWQAVQKGAEPVFTVFPGRLREITIQNKSRVHDAQLQRLIRRALCGRVSADDLCILTTPRLERATQLLQDLPGVAIDKAPRVSPGAGTGEVNVTFSLAEKGKKYGVDLIADNNGIETTGSYRFGLTGSVDNVFGVGDAYAFTITDTNKNMWTGSFTGSVPILDDGLRLTGGVSRQQYHVNSITPITGVATTGSAGISYPFTRGLDLNVWGSASLLHSETSTDLKSYAQSTHSTIDSVQLSVQANNGDRAQQLRTNLLSGQGAITLGHQRNDYFNAPTVANPAGNYVKFSGSGFGTYALNTSGNVFTSARISGQVANRNLDASEKLVAGGPDAVRAYRPDEVSFNDGVVSNFGIYRRFQVAPGHQLQVGAFIDVAYGRVNHDTWAGWENTYVDVPGVTNGRLMAGYGLSLDWLTPIGATASVAVSKPFGFSAPSLVDHGKRPTQVWLSVKWSH